MLVSFDRERQFQVSVKDARGGFKFFSEGLDQQLIRAIIMVKDADVLANGDGALPIWS